MKNVVGLISVTAKLGGGVGEESRSRARAQGATREGKEEGTGSNLIQEHGEGAEPCREGAEPRREEATNWDPGVPVCTRSAPPQPHRSCWVGGEPGHGPTAGREARTGGGEDRGSCVGGCQTEEARKNAASNVIY